MRTQIHRQTNKQHRQRDRNNLVLDVCSTRCWTIRRGTWDQGCDWILLIIGSLVVWTKLPKFFPSVWQPEAVNDNLERCAKKGDSRTDAQIFVLLISRHLFDPCSADGSTKRGPLMVVMTIIVIMMMIMMNNWLWRLWKCWFSCILFSSCSSSPSSPW